MLGWVILGRLDPDPIDESGGVAARSGLETVLRY